MDKITHEVRQAVNGMCGLPFTIETTVVKKLRKNYPAYDYYVESINNILAENPKLVGVLERGNIVALSEEDVEDLVSIIRLHMDHDILMRKAIYHEGVLNGMRMNNNPI